MISILLDDDEKRTRNELRELRTAIGSPIATDKIDAFVYSDATSKATMRKHAADNNIDLVFVVVRGDEMPQLPAWDLQRFQLAESEAKIFLRSKPSKQAQHAATHFNVRLAFDLANYLDAVSRDRDARSIRKLLAEGSTIQAWSSLAGPFIELLQRFAKGGNLPPALSNLETFLDQLIVQIETVRSRVQDEQKSVRSIDKVLSSHQKSLYQFLNRVHRRDT
jgi:hypothetical protein